MIDGGRQALGQELCRLRREAGLTQATVGAAIGRRKSAVSELERGQWRRLPDSDLIDRFVERCLRAMNLDRTTADARRAEIRRYLQVVHDRDDTAGGPISNLPRDIPTFTARKAQLEQLRKAARTRAGVVAVHAVDGMPGVGKTALAVRAAHQLGSGLPDFQLFVDLHGHTPGMSPVTVSEALEILLRATGVAPQSLPNSEAGKIDLWRRRVAGRRGVLVLDNARSASQVVPLLPGSDSCLVIVTSRRRLADLNAQPVRVDILAPDDAVTMLSHVAGRALNVNDELARELVALAGHLPLAISLLAGRLRTRPAMQLEDLLVAMRHSTGRLAALADRDRGVAAAFDVSYRSQPIERRRFLRLLGLQPGPDIDAFAASAVALLPLEDAEAHLVGLFDEHVLDEHQFGRFDMHDLIAEYVRALGPGVGDDEAADAVMRLLLYYECTARDADAWLGPADRRPSSGSYNGPRPALRSRAAALAWFESERANLSAAIEAAADRPVVVIRLVDALSRDLRLTGPWMAANRLHDRALAAAMAQNDRGAQGRALLGIGRSAKNAGDYRRAEEALTAVREITPNTVEADHALLELGSVHYLLGRYDTARSDFERALGSTHPAVCAGAELELGSLAYLEDRYTDAESHLDTALALYRELDDPAGQASALKNLGNTHYFADRYDQAEDTLNRARLAFSELGDRLGVAQSATKIGSIQRLRGDCDAAVQTLTRAVADCRQLGDRSLEAEALIDLAAALGAVGDAPAAEVHFAASIRLYDEIGEFLGRACAHKEFADLLRGVGRLDEAARQLDEASRCLKAVPDQLMSAAVANSRGALLLAANDVEGARKHHRMALSVAIDIGSPLEEATAHAGLGRAAGASGAAADARRHLSEAVAIYRRIGAAEAHCTAVELKNVPGSSHAVTDCGSTD